MKNSVRLARIAGIDIGVHYSWLLIFALVVMTLSLGFLRLSLPGRSETEYWVGGTIAAVVLFVSVLLHEIAHSLVAQANGIKVNSITLFVFGGVSSLEDEPERPAGEFRMAIAGPAASLLLAAVFAAGYVLTQRGKLTDIAVFPSSVYTGFGGAIFHYLALMNGLLFAFNLLPAFPLDGGRVLRSALWRLSRSLARATRIATGVGRLFGAAFVALGIYWVFESDPFGGIWIGLIGLFLYKAANSTPPEVSLREHMVGVRVRDALFTQQEAVPAAGTLEDLAAGILSQRYGRVTAVQGAGGEIIGVITVADMSRVPRQRWSVTLTRDVVTNNELCSIGLDEDLATALKMLARHGADHLLVTANGQHAGVLTRTQILNYLCLRSELQKPARTGRSPETKAKPEAFPLRKAAAGQIPPDTALKL